MTNLDALDALLRDATPGPWTVHADTNLILRLHSGGDGREDLRVATVSVNTMNDEGRHNRDLIVAAVNALPALIAELRAAREDAGRYRWLRNADNWQEEGPMPIIATFNSTIYGAALDAAIDAARSAT
jgi:hypothetical protein